MLRVPSNPSRTSSRAKIRRSTLTLIIIIGKEDEKAKRRHRGSCTTMAWAPPLSSSSSFSFFFLLFVPWWATGLSPSSSTRYLVVGGNGRVGGSTAKHLHILSEVEGRGPAELILGGRSRSSFEASKARILEQLDAISLSSKPASSYASEYASSSSAHPEISFQELDIDGEGGGGDRVVAALAAAMTLPLPRLLNRRRHTRRGLARTRRSTCPSSPPARATRGRLSCLRPSCCSASRRLRCCGGATWGPSPGPMLST